MKDDDPIALATAAADFGVPKGVLKANGVAGKLRIYKLGTRYYTTPNAVREWVESCLVEAKAPGSTSTRLARSGSSATDRASSVLAAARATVEKLKTSSRNTSGRSTAQSRQVRQ